MYGSAIDRVIFINVFCLMMFLSGKNDVSSEESYIYIIYIGFIHVS